MKALFYSLFLSVLSYTSLNAQTDTTRTTGGTASAVSDALFTSSNLQFLLGLAGILFIVILVLFNIFKNAAKVHLEREQEKKHSKIHKSIGGLLIILTLVSPLMAQNQALGFESLFTPNLVGFLVLVLIVIELFAIWLLLKWIKFYTGIEAYLEKHPELSFWDKFKKDNNLSEDVDDDSLATDHNYDGIRELDNPVPGWFTAAFALCILFSIVYVWRYHVSKSAPLQLEEYLAVEAKAKAEKETFLKTQASSIVENTVTLLTGADVEAGKKVFSSNCIACHGSDGQGGTVGPNLSDAYWIHGGDLPSVFKSIKYGWEEKGMRAWSDDLTPLQIAQVASYLNSIQGKSFPNPKEAQGELYTPGATTEAPKDSTNTSTKDTTLTP